MKVSIFFFVCVFLSTGYSMEKIMCKETNYYSWDEPKDIRFIPIDVKLEESKWKKQTPTVFCETESCTESFSIQVTETNTISKAVAVSLTKTSSYAISLAIAAGVNAKFSVFGLETGTSLTSTATGQLQFSTSKGSTSTYTIAQSTAFSVSGSMSCTGKQGDTIFMEIRLKYFEIMGILCTYSHRGKKKHGSQM